MDPFKSFFKFLIKISKHLLTLPSLKVTRPKRAKIIAPQSREILLTFVHVCWGQEHTEVSNFVTLRSYIFLSLQQITFNSWLRY